LGLGPPLGRLGDGGERDKYEKWEGESREVPRFHRGHGNSEEPVAGSQ
jgi:hypothetical protein